ncbi:hypothetical protein R1sor_024592 [Riccia sorocarpa]|uniref:Reverse transcriptase zinc-binding domain-containing protein n=1 Tax=Riccia sorocarpa TaxID=122646 RepID=A0ABD3GSH5_9MARC
MNLMKEAWLNETAYVRDDRKKWARGWYRVKQVLKAENAKGKIRREEGDLEKEVVWRREVISEDPSSAEVEMLHSLEQRLKIRDLEDAKRWRLRSRVSWLSTKDAPLRYFFAKLRAKWAKESLRAIELDDGTVSTDAEEILQEIQRFYQVLYTAEEDTEERSRARDEVIGLMVWGAMRNEDSKAFILLNKVCRKLRLNTLQDLWGNREKINIRSWGVETDPTAWLDRWRLLWLGSSLFKHKIWIWRIIRRGLPTFGRMARWGVVEGSCQFCWREEESVEHLMWDCRRLRRRTSWVISAVGGEQCESSTFFQVLDCALKEHKFNPGPLILLSEHCRWSWYERNQWIYEGEGVAISNKHILDEVIANLAAVTRNTSGDRKERIQRHNEIFVSHLERMIDLWEKREEAVSNLLRECLPEAEREEVELECRDRCVRESSDSESSYSNDSSEEDTTDSSSQA